MIEGVLGCKIRRSHVELTAGYVDTQVRINEKSIPQVGGDIRVFGLVHIPFFEILDNFKGNIELKAKIPAYIIVEGCRVGPFNGRVAWIALVFITSRAAFHTCKAAIEPANGQAILAPQFLTIFLHLQAQIMLVQVVF